MEAWGKTYRGTGGMETLKDPGAEVLIDSSRWVCMEDAG